MPKKKKPKKGQRKGAQKGPGNSAVDQGSVAANSESSATEPQAVASAAQATGSGGNTPQAGSDDQKTKGPSPVGFAQGTKEELAKVVWPDRQQLISESAAVILMVSFLAIFISLIDNVFSWASRLVF